jgi:hypothetical protein
MRHPHSSTAVRDYLNKTVVPSLLAGMKKMVRERYCIFPELFTSSIAILKLLFSNFFFKATKPL